MLRFVLFGLLLSSAHSAVFAQPASNSVATEVHRLHAGGPVDRSQAARALGALGESAAPAAPHLVQALCDPDPFVVRAATDALCRIGSSATAPLLVALECNDPKWRHQAAIALSRIGPTDAAAVKAIVKALRDDPVAEVRRRAAMALARGGKPGDGVLTALVGALKDHDATVRIAAAVALGNFGAEARDASGPLSGLLKGNDLKLKSAARDALRKIAAEKRP
jgi:HEAT repeat protein